MSMDYEDAISLIDFAVEKDIEEILFHRWIHDLQFQMSFDEFKQKLKPQKLRDDKEILAEVKDILTLF